MPAEQCEQCIQYNQHCVESEYIKLWTTAQQTQIHVSEARMRIEFINKHKLKLTLHGLSYWITGTWKENQK